MDFQRVLDAYGGLVSRIARARMTNAEDVEDILQNVFLTYARKQPVFPNEAAERVWFIRTTSNFCKMKWRTIQRHAVEPLELANEVAADQADYTELREAFSRLPDKYSRPMELFYFADLPADEVGRILGVSVNAVYIRLSRGRDLLKNWLKDETRGA